MGVAKSLPPLAFRQIHTVGQIYRRITQRNEPRFSDIHMWWMGLCVCVCWVDHVANSVLICRGGYQSSETQLSFQLGTKTKFAHNLTFVLSREIDSIYTRANTCPF